MRRQPATIVILAWNEWAATRACLDSIRPTLGVEDQVVVVDNGSTDETPRGLQRYSWADIVTNDENRGFAGGCNDGAAVARNELIVFLNNDTLPVGHWLDALLGPFADDTVGATGSRSNFVSGPQLVEEVGYQSARRSHVSRFEREWRQSHKGQVTETNRLVGFCIAVRRDAFETIGGFDEGFGLGGYEDDDLCTRLRDAGHRLLIAHGSFVHHDGHKTFDANGIDWFALQQENQQLFRDKHGNDLAVPTASDDAPLLSACLIVRDEEEYLDSCLASIRGLVDEIVVYDTGSTDRTMDIARSFGATVIEGYWDDDFARARNDALDACTGTWILQIDADEELTVDGDLRAELISAEEDAISVRIDNLGVSGGLKFQHVATRLFRRERGHWAGALHEQVVARSAGAALVFGGSATATFRHHGYGLNETSTRAKQERNLRVASAAVESSETPDAAALLHLGLALCEAGRFDDGVVHFERAMSPEAGPALRRRARREGIVALLEARRAAEALEWTRRFRTEALDASVVDYLEARARAELGDRDGALALLRPLRSVRDGDGYVLPESSLHIRRGEICADAGRWNEAFDSLVRSAELGVESIPWALMADSCFAADKHCERVTALLEESDLVDVVGQVLAASPDAADRLIESVWTRFPEHPVLLAGAVRLAPQLAVERALEWSARLRMAGLERDCPLVAIAHDDDRQVTDRVRAVALVVGAFDFDAGSDLLATVAPSVRLDEFTDVLVALDALMPALLPCFIERLASTPQRCQGLSVVLEQLGAPEEAAVISEIGHALATDGADGAPRTEEARPAGGTSLSPGVFVLGMHRSGTSAVTRALNLLGPRCAVASDLMPPENSQNATGFWESTSLTAVNDGLLDRLGGSWWAPPTSGARAAMGSLVADEGTAARTVFETSHGEHGGWVWKDPRTCVTFPFWSAVLPVSPVIVVPYRNPLEVWRSLERRDGFDKAHALALWERYTRSALESASGHPTLVCAFDDVLADPERWCEMAGRFLNDHGIQADVHGSLPAVKEFLESDLRHVAHSAADLSDDEDITSAQRVLWERLEDLRGAHHQFIPGELPAESYWVEPLLDALRAQLPYHSGRALPGSLPAAAARVDRYTVPPCSIIIPLFNKVDYTRRCLESLIEATDDDLYELVLVDNASTDDTESLLRRLDGDVFIIRNEQNLGYAAACNQGARAARGTHLMFLNNDTEAQHDWLPPLLSRLEAEPGTVAVGSRLLFPDGRVQHAGVHVAEDRRDGQVPLAAFHRLYCAPADHAEVLRPSPISALTGASMLVRRSAFFDAGGFDEGFWNGYEDVDLCFKLREAGGTLVYEPASCLVHHESVSGPERFSKQDQNVDRLVRRWAGRVPADVVIDEETGTTVVDRPVALEPIRPASSPADPERRQASV